MKPVIQSRLKFLIAVGLALLITAGCIERKPERLAKKESPVSTELAAMVAEQEQARQDSRLTTEQLSALQQRHRHSVYRLLSQALVREPEDLYRAALLLQSADETSGRETLLQAHDLAVAAAEKGHPPAKFLAAACLDRYLVMTGKPQHYGTQRFKDDRGRLRLYPIDSATGDSERVAWDVPPLDALQAEIDSMNTR